MRNRIAFLGVFSALAIILGYVESLIPFFMGIPGMKLGLANMAVISVLYLDKPGDALLISLVRILVIGALFGNLFSVLYSAAGAGLSFLVMVLLKKTDRFSIRGVSVAGGVSHNLGQLIVAMFVVETTSLLYYFPFLLISGVVTGFLIGTLGAEITRRMKGILKL